MEGQKTDTGCAPNIKGLLGYEPSEFLKVPDFWGENVHPDDAGRAFAEIARVFEAGSAASEYRFRHKDGSWRWMHDEIRLMRDGEGRPVECVGSWTDVTWRKEAEAAVIKSEGKFKSIFDNSLDAILLSSRDGVYFTANRAACLMLGYTEDELKTVGRDAVMDNDDPATRAYLLERLASGSARAEVPLIRKGGKRFPAEVSASEFEDAEGRTMACIVIRDITERRQLERQRSDFLAMVTHDLKSPLTAITGYTELIVEGAGGNPAETVEMAGRILGAGRKLSTLVEDFTTVSKVVSGRLSPMKRPEDPAAVLAGLEAGHRPAAGRKGIRFIVETAADVPIAMLDRGLLERALDNLLVNAFNYTEPGGEVTGTGLGLAVVKAVVEAHGGRVALESAPGMGSTFTISLPIR